ncbi:synapsin-1-like [Balaenoptera ricei]|uniref:synapsin-1-like n=1 Tax=Balaenoptera ricei TaxID=2746895 RepID=UPI0028BDF700|nr:synapsin-1-like [Balaenoptera ricei]
MSTRSRGGRRKLCSPGSRTERLEVSSLGGRAPGEIRGPRKGEPGRSTSLSRRPQCPAAARRGCTQRRLKTGGPRIAPTRRAKAPRPGAERSSLGEARTPGSGLRAGSEQRGIQRGSGKEKGKLTSQPRPAWGSARGRPASAQAAAREVREEVSAEISTS